MLGVACAGGRANYNFCPAADDDCDNHECIDQASAIFLLIVCFVVLLPWAVGFVSMFIPSLLEASIYYLRRGLGIILGVTSLSILRHSTSASAAEQGGSVDAL
jgi:hypothetical protein